MSRNLAFVLFLVFALAGPARAGSTSQEVIISWSDMANVAHSVLLGETTTVAQLQFDGITNSPLSDTRFSGTMQLVFYTTQAGSLANCRLQTVPTTASPTRTDLTPAVSPSAIDTPTSGVAVKFSISSSLVVPAGTEALVNVVCDVAGPATATFGWSLPLQRMCSAKITSDCLTTDTGVNPQVTGTATEQVTVATTLDPKVGLYSDAPADYGSGYCFAQGSGAPTDSAHIILNPGYDPNDPADHPFDVSRYPSAPPATDAYNSNYKTYPLSIADTAALDKINRDSSSTGKYYFLFANFSDGTDSLHDGYDGDCTGDPAGDGACNPVPDQRYFRTNSKGGQTQIYTRFSSLINANSCTLAQEAYALGIPVGQTDGYAYPYYVRALAGGAPLGTPSSLDVVYIEPNTDPNHGTIHVVLNRGTNKTVDGSPLDGSTLDQLALDGNHFKDLCVLPYDILQNTAVNFQGIMLDYEVHDGRSEDNAYAFLTKVVDVAKAVQNRSLKAFLYTNPLDANGQIDSGLVSSVNGNLVSAHLNDLVNYFDYVTVMAHRQTPYDLMGQVVRAQYDLLQGAKQVDSNHVALTFELDGTTVDDAQWARNYALSTTAPLRHVILWQHQGSLEGSCEAPVNQRIKTLVDIPAFR